jgi:CHAT domain-containing protein/Tfp pilus assembly protein PilF
MQRLVLELSKAISIPARSAKSICIVCMLLWVTSAMAAYGGSRPEHGLNYESQTHDSEARQAEVVELKQGPSIERELGGGGRHAYRISLAKGHYIKVVVEQKGIDVVVTLFGTNGQMIAEVDSPNGTQGPEPIAVIVETSGDHRLEVKSLEEKAPAGRYELRVEELREATPQDRDRIAALRALAEAVQLRAQGTGESLRKSIEKYNQTLPLLRATGDHYEEANTLREMGIIYTQISENQKALDYFGQSLALYRSIGNVQLEARILNRIGAIQSRLGEQQKALEYHLQALSLTRASKDPSEEATSLAYIGRIHTKLGDPRRALEHFDQALILIRQVGDRWAEAYILDSVGTAYSSLGDLQKAVESYDQALRFLRLAGDRYGERASLNNLGYTYSKLGELLKALEYYGQSLQLSHAAGDRYDEAYTLDNIGKIYDRLSEPRKALQHYDQALEIRRAIGHRPGQATTLHNIGEVYLRLGEQQRALDYFNQSLALKRALGDRREEAYTLDSIGGVYLSWGQFPKALDYHNQSLILRRAVDDRYGEAYALANIGTAYDQLGDLPKAQEYFAQALKLRQTIGDRYGEAQTLSDIGSTYGKLREANRALEYYRLALGLSRTLGYQTLEPSILFGIARVERERGNIAEARSQIEGALNIIESTRAKVAGQALRTSYLASQQDYYKFYIDLLMQMQRRQPAAGYDALALQASERARARSLLDILSESRADIRQGVDPALLDKKRTLQQQLSAKSEGLARLLSGKHAGEQERAARKELDALVGAYQDIETQIQVRSPRYAALTQPEPLFLEEIQQQVLDDETLLLEYVLGEERSYLWAVTTDSIKSFELPGRAELEAAARRVYELLVAKADTLYPEALTTLSHMLLKPAADQLGRKRLLIVSEGALQYIPFGALPVPEMRGGVSDRRASSSSRRRATSTPLILNHEIVSLPSASVLAVLRRELGGRRSAVKTLAVLADPVFEKNDQRVRASVSAQQVEGHRQIEEETDKTAPPSDVERSTRELGLNSFDRLVLSRREAEIITSLASAGLPLKALDFDASRATATSPELGQYRMLHFATHSLLNNQHPELSGIILSLVDEQGRPQDGFLRLYEIYNLKLGADLVVLSACQTALGKEIKGEGLVGLTRGFMYAGVPRVMASLWKVSDRATAELMKRVYQNMLKDGMRPAAALRAAQVSMLKEKQWQASYYWAGFVIQGEWN